MIPMIIQNLPPQANLSAFSMWIIIGLFVSLIDFQINYILKGILISFLVLTPSAILIGWDSPESLIPITIMTLILGCLVGIVYNFLIKKFF